MQITFLGHAGFFVETTNSIIVMDPWLSSEGAFDAAWFQYPKNHFLAEDVRQRLSNTKKEKFIYISHEHQDHFDIRFLNSLEHRDFTLILGDFTHSGVKKTLQQHHYHCSNTVILKDKESLSFKDGQMTLFLTDMELDADSALLIKATTGTFLNLNDCKIHDRLTTIVQELGSIDVFAGQFSGAIWQPICYKMTPEDYETACNSKNLNKFKIIESALKILKPSFYLPSAGPPCFLDPELIHIHYQKVNTFTRAKQLINFLDERFSKTPVSTQWPEIMPGDILDVSQKKFTYLSPHRVEDGQFLPYIEAYAQEYASFFEKRAQINKMIVPKDVFIKLEEELSNKLQSMKILQNSILINLYFSLRDYPDHLYRIDFQNSKLTTTTVIEDPKNFYSIQAPAWQINKVLTRELSWEDFSLTFRVALERIPDIYNTLLHAFLTLDHDRLEHFCHLFQDILSKKERITVRSKGEYYSILRYCPHQGGDLLHAKIEDGLLICPRHHWKFDLNNGGLCPHTKATIDAKHIPLKTEQETSTPI